MQRIFLTGLSGSGKSTIGRQVARLLGWSFVDTDDVLAERMGLPVGQVLVEYGEQRFRELESEALEAASRQERIVIATGGGAIIAEGNRTFMREHGLAVYLHVTVETAWQRIQDHLSRSGTTVVRPLLAGADGQQRLRDLYAARKQYYEQAELQINTDGHSPDVLARQVLAGALAYGYLSSSTMPQEIITLKLAMVSSQARVEWGGLHHLSQALQSLGFSS